MTCPVCGEPLIGLAVSPSRNALRCSDDCGFERDAIEGQEPDDTIMETASEKYWLAKWANL